MKRQRIPVSKLVLDPNNYRHPRMANEIDIVNALIKSHPAKYLGLLNSILEEYIPTENILVYKDRDANLMVAEGNRRISILKLITKQISLRKIRLTEHYINKIKKTTKEMRKKLTYVDCLVYGTDEIETVDRLVARIHGKDDDSSRQQWNPLCKARHNRDKLNKPEPGLELLEKFIATSDLPSPEETEEWQLYFSVPALDELLIVCAKLFSCEVSEILNSYESLSWKKQLDKIVVSIGREEDGYEYRTIRTADFLAKHGIDVTQTNQSSISRNQLSSGANSNPQQTAGPSASNNISLRSGGMSLPLSQSAKNTKTFRNALKALVPRGHGREKIVTLRDESLTLDIKKTPNVFVFVLRSIIEISATVYAGEHGIEIKKRDKNGTLSGERKELKALLQDIKIHLCSNDEYWKQASNKTSLDDSLRHLTSGNMSLLSITDMHNTVHSTTGLASADLIYAELPHILPLIKAMNNDTK
jgi:hypothetical protein